MVNVIATVTVTVTGDNHNKPKLETQTTATTTATKERKDLPAMSNEILFEWQRNIVNGRMTQLRSRRRSKEEGEGGKR